MSRLRRRSTLVLTALVLSFVTPPAAQAADPEYERILNGTFDTDKSPWWSSGSTPSAVEGGRLCAQVPAGTVNVWDAMIGQDDIPVEAGQDYRLRFTATASRDVTVRAVVQLAGTPQTTVLNKPAVLSGTPQAFEFTASSTVTSDHAQASFQAGGRRSTRNVTRMNTPPR